MPPFILCVGMCICVYAETDHPETACEEDRLQESWRDSRTGVVEEGEEEGGGRRGGEGEKGRGCRRWEAVPSSISFSTSNPGIQIDFNAFILPPSPPSLPPYPLSLPSLPSFSSLPLSSSLPSFLPS